MDFKIQHLILRSVLITFAISFNANLVRSQILKSIVYDFDGLNIDQTSLPESDYRFNDLTYKVAANPLSANDMLGDRVLKLNLNWSTGNGTFGRAISRYIEFNPNQDRINFYFYNPVSNNQSANLAVIIADDDNQSNTYSVSNDDTWKTMLTISGASGWQFFSIPLKDFTDSNSGGNGIFDMTFTQNKGMILQVEFKFTKATTSATPAVFYIDMICFSEGALPTGNTVFDLPGKNVSDKCLLGAFTKENKGQHNLTPEHIENLFPAAPVKHIKYVNWFIQFAEDGSTTAKELPGNEVKLLLDNGYTPILTWEPMFQQYSRLDPVQPRLSNIINGDYNSYFDAFADKIKLFNDTVIIRLMHEFNGDWYSWSIVENNQDPNLYIAAYRKVVDRFRVRGATKVKWMWCVNANYFPSRSYNWSVNAYPGDAYVDIVAIDVYNNHYPADVPWWMSFREKITESYYYLTKYFPNKPLFICEIGCRERYASEPTSSQTKGNWWMKTDKELQSNFHKVKAMLFFSTLKVYDWRINSTSASLNSISANIWNDDYYFKSTVPVPNLCSATGNITRDVWNNFTGTSLTQIPVSTTPSSTSLLSVFEGPKNAGDKYASRIRGYICPPVTGNYTFWISSDNSSALYLSTDNTSGNKQRIAYLDAWTAYREWEKYPAQKSQPIFLTAGNRYYIEALHRESIQGDHIEVGWQLPNGVLERPIPGSRLSPYVSAESPGIVDTTNAFATIGDHGTDTIEQLKPIVCKAEITPEGSTTFCAGGSVKLYGTTGSGITYQWIKNNIIIPDATSASYLADQEGEYQIKISFKGCNDWSAPAKVTINSALTSKITAGGPTTFCNGDNVKLYANTCPGYVYQWKKNGADIPGATSAIYIASTTGTYQLKVISGSSVAWSGILSVTVNTCRQTEALIESNSSDTAGIEENENFHLLIYPNPTSGLFSLEVCMEDVSEEKFSIEVVNSLGQIVYNKPGLVIKGCLKETIELSESLATGIYIMKVTLGNKTEGIRLLLKRQE